jgi:ABC-type antimicrobial peptide transport system permease subunit
VSDVQSYDTRLGETIARPRFAAYLLGLFAIVTVFLTAVGVYGVLSHAMSRRVREIGVRLAFGASGRDVFKLLFRHGMVLTIAGLLIGIPLAAASTRYLSALLFGVTSASALVFAGVIGVLLLVGFFVSYLPARRASTVDPMVALRCE